ncbi:MAG: DUF1192 domain-containing protein [Microvirga sp.]
MAFDPFAEESIRASQGLEIGQDLSLLSIDEIDERLALLATEIARLKETRDRKESSRAAASAIFNLGST